jgi:uncharacterized RDD family membrane protein YckC
MISGAIVAENEGRVYGLDNVALDLPLAGVGSRVLAGFLDYLVVGVLAIAWLIGGSMLAGALAFRSPWAGAVMFALALLGVFLIEYGYFAGFEIATGGRTPGKMALGLTVVTRQGALPTWGVLLARNLVRTVDLLIGVPLMIVDPVARRLGDRLAGTVVIYQVASASHLEAPLARVPRGWGAREVTLLESFLRREPELDRQQARDVATRLLDAIRRDDPALLADHPAGGDPVVLLRLAVDAPRR